jgi:uncharacterized protein (DUF433 family)
VGFAVDLAIEGSVKFMAATVLTAFSEDHVVRLTGLSRWQLREWDKLEFFAPHYAYEDRKQPYSRIYSFADVVGLRTISVLMKQYHVSFQQLKKVATELVKRGYKHWAELKLYVVKGQVHFQHPSSKDIEGVWDGQLAMLPVIDVITDLEKRVSELQNRTQDQIGNIEQRRHVMRNSPVLAGTRIPTAAVRRFHEAGYSTEEILKQYPTLTAEDVSAALAYEERLARRA